MNELINYESINIGPAYGAFVYPTGNWKAILIPLPMSAIMI